MTENPLLKPVKATKRRIKKVNLDRLTKKAVHILDREIDYLFTLSKNHKLEEEDAKSLREYLKLLKQLQKEDNTPISISDLEKIANS